MAKKKRKKSRVRVDSSAHSTGYDFVDIGQRAMRWALFPAAIVFGVLIRLSPEMFLAMAGRDPLSVWCDEVWTLMIAKIPLLDSLYLIHHFDANPPLSYLFLRLVPQLADGTVVRIMPGLLSALALGSFLWLMSKYLKRDELWLAGVLLALSPIHYWYAVNLRYYSLMDLVAVLWLVSTVTILALGRQIRENGKVFPAGSSNAIHIWLFLSICGILTHHLFAAAWLAGIIALLAGLGRKFFMLFRRPIQYLWVVVPLVYWFQVFRWQQEFVSGYKTSLVMPGFTELLGLFRDFLLLYGSVPTAAAAVIILLPFGMLAYDLIRKMQGRELVPVIIPISIWVAFFPPIASYIAMVITGNPQLMSRRYLIPSGVAFIVLWAFGCLKLRVRSLRLALILSVVFFNLMGLYAVLFIQDPPNWQEIARMVKPRSGVHQWIVSREPIESLVVNESSCLATYLPATEYEGLMHFSVSMDGPSLQEYALSETISRMGDRAVRGFRRFYPPHISMDEFAGLIGAAGATAGSNTEGGFPGGFDHMPGFLRGRTHKASTPLTTLERPRRIFVIYHTYGSPPPEGEGDMGLALDFAYKYQGRIVYDGICVDEWTEKYNY
ncbi:hypothetical protein J7K50_08205 [bacterium]|nr:hypothetical protein [bacterium]